MKVLAVSHVSNNVWISQGYDHVSVWGTLWNRGSNL